MNVVKQPSSVAPAYKHDELVYIFEDKIDVVSTSDTSGRLSLLFSTTAEAERVEQSQFIYYHSLKDVDNLDTAVVNVFQRTNQTIVLDTPFVSGLAPAFVRLFERKTFVIQTVSKAFQFGTFGLASAMSVVLLALVLMVTAIQRILVKDERSELV
jgi:hypothetical protein